MKLEWSALGWAWLTILLAGLLLTFLVGFAVEQEDMQTTIVGVGSFAAGGYVAYRLAGERKGLHALLAIVGYYLILLAFVVVAALLA